MRFLLPLIGLLALAGLASPSWAEEGAAAATDAPATAEAAPAEAAPAEAAPAEEAAPTFADNLKAYGIELSEDEAKAVADYDAKPDGYAWPTYGENNEGSIAADLIGKIKEAANKDSYFTTSNLWLMLSAALVFIMHLGFATLESGLCRSKNTVNILFKNVMIVCIGLLTYALCGFVTMYPGSNWIIEDFFAFGTGVGFDLSDPVAYLANMTSQYGYPYTVFTDFLFQGMFAATAATIISGAVAERIKLLPFLVFVTLYVAFLYPVLGSWKWGGGWLGDQGFVDFAGSTLVHSVGGWGALVAILILGPRHGKFTKEGVRPVLPHSLPLATIGVFLLWLGWFGFNGGSVLAAQGGDVSYVLVTTSLAAAMGGFAAGITSWVVGKKPDLSMALNGILAGLVGITAGPDCASIMTTLFIGLSSGVIVYFSVLTFDKLKIDDPVGALSVHLVCGIWGTFCVVFSKPELLGVQLTGIAAYGGACVVFALIVGLIVKAIFGGLRVSTEEEEEGLDIGEHGTPAYHIPEAMGR